MQILEEHLPLDINTDVLKNVSDMLEKRAQYFIFKNSVHFLTASLLINKTYSAHKKTLNKFPLKYKLAIIMYSYYLHAFSSYIC